MTLSANIMTKEFVLALSIKIKLDDFLLIRPQLAYNKRIITPIYREQC